ncbi:MAG TPA: outer membrane beta-barrel protein [Candidatus Limnocylindria bacterium]|nr:outer membrane beta-barrel protein [Candidatus Limnocylindria bacterium]
MRTRGWMLVACLVATASPAVATTTWLGVNGGVAVPTGDFGDDANLGFTFGGSVDVRITETSSVGGEIGYAPFSGSDELESALSSLTGEVVDASLSAIPITATARLWIPSSGTVAPFLRFGVGAYLLRTTIEGETFEVDDSETAVGVNLGGGVAFETGENMMLGTDALYHYISTEGGAANLFTLRAVLFFELGGE